MSQILSFDADLSPINWNLNGIQHYLSIINPRDDLNIWCVGPGIEDWISYTDPTGIDDIGVLVKMQLTINVKLVSAPLPGGQLGVAFHVLKSDDTEMGSYGQTMVTNFVPHTYIVDVPLVGTGADVTNMKLRVRSYDIGGWPVGQGVVQIYEIIPELFYDPAYVPRDPDRKVIIRERDMDSPVILKSSAIQIPERFADPTVLKEGAIVIGERPGGPIIYRQ
jgi:hypothetical protein